MSEPHPPGEQPPPGEQVPPGEQPPSGQQPPGGQPPPVARPALVSGFCAILGRPNVGKSTLMNAIVGVDVAVTTTVPGTTRHAIRGVAHLSDGQGVPRAQIVFVDTPGLHKPHTTLGSRMNDVARDQLGGVDVALLLVDAAAGIGRGDRFVAGLLADVPVPVLAVANKVDRLARARQLPVLAELARLGEFEEIVPVSARTGEGLDTLTELIVDRLPQGPAYFPADMTSDQPLTRVLAERIRGHAIVRMREEVPHSVAVVVEEIRAGDREDVRVVDAVLYVERESQRGIVIGRAGKVLAEIGTAARADLEAILGTRVFLDLRVKLMKDWQRDPKALDRLGY